MEGIYNQFLQIICSNIVHINNILKCQKIMDGSFNRFLSSGNAVLHTPTELYTHHYVHLYDLTCDPLQQVFLHTSQ